MAFSYLDHNTKTYREFCCEGEAFIELLTQHISGEHFRMIRYYGFLTHRVHLTFLPKVNELLNHSKGIIQKICFQELLKQSFGLDPLQCILCRSQLRFSGITPGLPLTDTALSQKIGTRQKKLANLVNIPGTQRSLKFLYILIEFLDFTLGGIQEPRHSSISTYI